jgi:1,2-diacylglycerol 3-alpha-glucosyltransferase
MHGPKMPNIRPERMHDLDLPAHPSSEPRLRLCLLAACPFPANHGTPGSIRELSEALHERGHEVRVVTYHMGQDIPIAGPHLHRITPLTRESGVVVGPTSRRPLYDLQMVFEAIQVIRRHRVDVVHAHGYEAALVGWLCKLATGVPVVYSGHNTMADELHTYDFIRPQFVAHGLARLLDAFVPRLGNRCIPHSQNIDKFLRGMGLGHRTDPVVNFGINVEAVSRGDGQRVKREYGLGDGPVVMYAGVMDQFQRVDLLLDAMVPVLRSQPQAKLLLVVTIDQPKHLENIRAHIARLGIGGQVVITAPQDFSALPDFLQACDVAVVPRPGAPGFPIKLLNYMSARKACVMFNSSASRLQHGRNAYLVAEDTSAALGAAIVDVLEDESLREQLAAGGYDFVRANHDRRLTAAQLCDTYLGVLSQRKGYSRLAVRPRIGARSARHQAAGLEREARLREPAPLAEVAAAVG